MAYTYKKVDENTIKRTFQQEQEFTKEDLLRWKEGAEKRLAEVNELLAELEKK